MVQVHKKFTQFYFLDKRYHYTITIQMARGLWKTFKVIVILWKISFYPLG